MSEQAIGETAAVPAAFNGAAATPPIDFDKPLDFDEIMSAARRPERTARILIRADLLGDLDEKEADLEEMHARRMQTNPDESLGGDELRAKAQEVEDLRRQIAESTRSIRLRAMPKDEWVPFAKEHTGDDGNLDDGFWIAVIAKCAIRPELTEAQVLQMRTQLGQPAIDNISTAAWRANTADGLDVPKSRLSSQILAPQESS